MYKKLFNTKPVMAKIKEIILEEKDTRTYILQMPFKTQKPKVGQYVMVWVPGVDEFPIGIAGWKEELLELCVAKVGEGTTALFNLVEGDYLGIRGFFGTGFKTKENVTHIIVGGGFGMPPLKFLIKDLIERKEKQIIVFEGARTKEKLLYVKFLEELQKENKISFHPYTDDGSFGEKGFPTVGVNNFLEKNKNDVVIYSAGPEKMMKTLFDLSKKYDNVIDIQMSLADRYMRCGFGLCGACVVDSTGLRICVDGPVFSREQLEKIEDFGNYARLPSGVKKEI